jgi:hypothetical protein
MADCRELTELECQLLKELENVFRRPEFKSVAGNFQLAHRITHRVKDLKADECYVIEAKETGKGKFTVAKHNKKGAPMAAGADPCCFWQWDDPPGALICVGDC